MLRIQCLLTGIPPWCVTNLTSGVAELSTSFNWMG